MKPQTFQEQPFSLPLPLDRPEPAAGCGVCRALAKQRAAAERVGNLSGVSDCNVEIRNHPHGSRAVRKWS
ncbi:hypothetical protein GCM10018783_28970 [Streptomyces griseosporeus]|nr:hypothetical protein GCM10018783_28970 [Streptomyces griseosporeus]